MKRSQDTLTETLSWEGLYHPCEHMRRHAARELGRLWAVEALRDSAQAEESEKVSAIYSQDCACFLIAKGRAFPGLELHSELTEIAACRAWLRGDWLFRRSLDEIRPPIERYFAIHGPGGHVIGVRP